MSEDSSKRAPTNTKGADEAVTVDAPRDVVLPEVVAEILTKQGMPPAKAGQVSQEITVEVMRLHVGPLPTVEDFSGCNQVCPGAARDILEMAIRQQKHRNWVQKAEVIADTLVPVAAIVSAVGVIGLMLWGGIYLATINHEGLAATVLSGTGIATIAGAFLQMWRSNKTEPLPQNNKQQPKKKKR
jgi:uncharacterized membrane protein